MRKTIIVFLVFLMAFYTFNSEEIYKKDIRNRLVIQGIGIDVEDDDKYSVTIQAIDTNSQSATSSDGASQPPLKTYKTKVLQRAFFFFAATVLTTNRLLQVSKLVIESDPERL